MIRGSGLDRKTLKKIPYYPEPRELYKTIQSSNGWLYKINKEFYRSRDKALCSILYILGLRISEALRLRKEQFIIREGYIEVRAIELSKSTKKGKQRIDKYREGFLPLTGERSIFTELIVDYLEISEARLFNFKESRAYRIVTSYFPEFTCHWLRAFCENYLYSIWDRDLLAVADYVKVDAGTLPKYIRRRYEKYPKI